MPITKSAIKALRSSRRKREHNLVWKEKLKKALKTASKSNLADTISVIDKAAKRHILHKNKAARLKSRLMQKFGTPTKPRTKQEATPKKAKTTKPTKKTLAKKTTKTKKIKK